MIFYNWFSEDDDDEQREDEGGTKIDYFELTWIQIYGSLSPTPIVCIITQRTQRVLGQQLPSQRLSEISPLNLLLVFAFFLPSAAIFSLITGYTMSRLMIRFPLSQNFYVIKNYKTTKSLLKSINGILCTRKSSEQLKDQQSGLQPFSFKLSKAIRTTEKFCNLIHTRKFLANLSSNY